MLGVRRWKRMAERNCRPDHRAVPTRKSVLIESVELAAPSSPLANLLLAEFAEGFRPIVRVDQRSVVFKACWCSQNAHPLPAHYSRRCMTRRFH